MYICQELRRDKSLCLSPYGGTFLGGFIDTVYRAVNVLQPLPFFSASGSCASISITFPSRSFGFGSSSPVCHLIVIEPLPSTWTCSAGLSIALFIKSVKACTFG